MIVKGPANRFHIGSNTCWDNDVFAVTTCGEIWAGDNVIFGYGVKLLCGHHDYHQINRARHPFPSSGYDIRIGNGVWLASFCIIIGPCTIGENSVIGAGSVVSKDIPANQVWVGNPVKFIRNIDFEKHLATVGSYDVTHKEWKGKLDISVDGRFYVSSINSGGIWTLGNGLLTLNWDKFAPEIVTLTEDGFKSDIINAKRINP